MDNFFDTIVVGGGPAGGTAAFYLGEANQRVLVLEKDTLPRYKPCGGGLSASVLEQFPFPLKPVIDLKVKNIEYALRDKSVSIPLNGHSVQMVMRDSFDAYILQHAKAEILHGVAVRYVEEHKDRVEVTTKDGQHFKSRNLVAADGANSVVARSLGMRRKKVLASALEVEAFLPPDIFRRFKDKMVFIFGEVPYGYLWIFPKSDHLSVGIGALHPKPGQLKTTLKRVMARRGISIDPLQSKGHTLPIYTRNEPVSTQRVLLVGDAAGLVDPFSGEGIRFAVKSGKLAAETILSGHPDRYTRLIYHHIGRSHRLGYALAHFFYTYPEICFKLGSRNPFATNALVEMFSDQIGYGRVISRLIYTLPFFLGTEAVAALAGQIVSPNLQRNIRKTIYGREI